MHGIIQWHRGGYDLGGLCPRGLCPASSKGGVDLGGIMSKGVLSGHPRTNPPAIFFIRAQLKWHSE